VKRLRWSRRAITDLIAIGDYIAQDDPAAARRWLEVLRTEALRARRQPLAGRRVPEVGREEVREIVVKAYRIIYLVRATEVIVLTVFEGHRRFRDVDPESE
jgi:plasmid stabilization system protein ParE